MFEKVMRIESIRFKRTRDSREERGIMFNDDQLIVDMNSKVVEGHVFKYKMDHEHVMTMSELVPGRNDGASASTVADKAASHPERATSRGYR